MDNCLICFQDIHYKTTIIDYFTKCDCICGQCRRNFIKAKSLIYLDKLEVEALYVYDDFIENLLFSLKEGKDVALKSVFLHLHIRYIKRKYKGYTFVFMPSSQMKTKERGFLPLDVLFEEIQVDKQSIFEKQTDYKQSLQTYTNRKNVSKIVRLKKGCKIPDTKLLLVDDMCTSGATLQAGFDLLKGHAHEIKALVLCINQRLLK